MNRKQGRPQSEGRTPAVFEDVQANEACLARDVWVPDLSVEHHSWRLVRIPSWKSNVYAESAGRIDGVWLGSTYRASDKAFPMSEVVAN